ncbi:MAG: hypothetical protein WCK55_19455, partial [Verrucomicrobiota bacterium]
PAVYETAALPLSYSGVAQIAGAEYREPPAPWQALSRAFTRFYAAFTRPSPFARRREGPLPLE